MKTNVTSFSEDVRSNRPHLNQEIKHISYLSLHESLAVTHNLHNVLFHYDHATTLYNSRYAIKVCVHTRCTTCIMAIHQWFVPKDLMSQNEVTLLNSRVLIKLINQTKRLMVL